MGIGLLITPHKKCSKDGRRQADSGNHQRKCRARAFKINKPQRQRRNERPHIGLEQVGAHSGHVAHIIPNIVGDNRRISRVVLRDARLNLPHKVSAHIRRFCVDASAYTGKQRDRRRSKAESKQNIRISCKNINRAHTKHSQPGHAHTHHCPAGKRDGQSLVHAAFLRRIRGPDIRLRRNGHSKIPCQRRKQRPDHKAHSRDPVPDADPNQHKKNRNEENQYLVLSRQERFRAFADRPRNLLHPVRSRRLPANFRRKHRRKQKRNDSKCRNQIQ